MKKKVLVTGANGQLGLTFKELFEKKSEFCEFTFLSKANLDISKTDDIARVFESNKYDYCINCAAYTNVEQAEKTPEIAYKINADAVKLLANQCKSHDVILIHISTDYVFDGTKKEPYIITDKTNPLNVYGQSKLQGEIYISEICKKYYTIRTSWLYSKKHGKNFYKTILGKIGNTEEIRITDAQLGCPTNCDNLAKHIYKNIILKTPMFGISHFSDNVEMTWYDFAKAILKENNALDKVKLILDNNYVTFAKRPTYSVLKSTKLSDR
jgi:dTDP-4-dehydrorhamnose reductase